MATEACERISLHSISLERRWQFPILAIKQISNFQSDGTLGGEESSDNVYYSLTDLGSLGGAPADTTGHLTWHVLD